MRKVISITVPASYEQALFASCFDSLPNQIHSFCVSDGCVSSGWAVKDPDNFGNSPETNGVGGKPGFYGLNPLPDWIIQAIHCLNRPAPQNNWISRRFRGSFSSDFRYFIDVIARLLVSRPLFVDFPDIREGSSQVNPC